MKFIGLFLLFSPAVFAAKGLPKKILIQPGLAQAPIEASLDKIDFSELSPIGSCYNFESFSSQNFEFKSLRPKMQIGANSYEVVSRKDKGSLGDISLSFDEPNCQLDSGSVRGLHMIFSTGFYSYFMDINLESGTVVLNNNVRYQGKVVENY